jgi:hypothetical protein
VQTTTRLINCKTTNKIHEVIIADSADALNIALGILKKMKDQSLDGNVFGKTIYNQLVGKIGQTPARKDLVIG